VRKQSTNFPGAPSRKATRASTRRQAKCRKLLQGGSIWWTAKLASSMKPCAFGCLSQGDTREGMGSERLGICSHSFTCRVGKTHAFSHLYIQALYSHHWNAVGLPQTYLATPLTPVVSNYAFSHLGTCYWCCQNVCEHCQQEGGVVGRQAWVGSSQLDSCPQHGLCLAGNPLHPQMLHG